MGRGSPPSLTGWGGRAGRRDPPAARPGQRVGVGPLPGHRSGPEHRDPRRGVGLSPLPSTPGNGGLRWVQFPGTPGPLREAGPHQPSAPQAPLPPGYRDLCRGPRLPPRSSPWVPVTAPHPGIRALWSGRSVSRGVTGDPRAPGTGGAGFTWVSSRGDGGGGSTGGLPPQRGGTQRWSLRGPRTPCPAPTALAVRGEDGRRPGRGMLPAAVLRQGRPCYGRAAPKPPSHVLMASSGIVVILLTTAKLAQRKGEPQIAPRFPRSLLLKFGGEVGCQGKAIKCGNNYTRNSYEGSASIFK